MRIPVAAAIAVALAVVGAADADVVAVLAYIG